MAQALDTLEALLVYTGGGALSETDKVPPKRNGLRYILEVTLGQFIGVVVAIWCILRSIDSVFGVPGQYPSTSSGGYVPGTTAAQTSSSSTSETSDSSTSSRLRGNGSVKPVEEQPGSAAFTCKVVNIRSKRSLQTIARLSRSGPEVRRRLIEFSFQTQSSPLAASGNGHRRNDPSAAATASLHLPEGTAVGVAARRQDECEELLRLVVSGVIVADTSLQSLSKRLLDPPQESNAAGGGGAAESTNGEATLSAAGSASGVAASNSAAQPAATPVPPPPGQRDGAGTSTPASGKTARKSYLGFSTSSSSRTEAAGAAASANSSNGAASSGKSTASGGGLDLSAEMAFATGTEAVLNGLLDAAAQRQKHPHPTLCSFLNIPLAAAAVASVAPVSSDGDVAAAGGVPRSSNFTSASDDSDSDEDDYNSEDDENNRQDENKAGRGGAPRTGGAAAGGTAGELIEEAGDDGTKKLPPKMEWPDYPILVRCSEDVPMTIDLPGVSAYGALPINNAAQPIPFETNLFKGVAMIRIADISTTDHSYFDGKRRKMQVCVQGKFKKPLRFDQVFGGQEFSGGLQNIPGKWMIKWAFELLKPGLPKSFQADLFGPSPYFLSPLVLTAQKMRADHPDDGPPQCVSDHDIAEEMGHLLGPEYRGKNSDKGRKKAFGGANALAMAHFDTNVTYTFDYFQQFLRSDQFALDLGVKLLDLNHYLGHQPILLTMAKTMDTGEYLWKFELWHERCVPSDTTKPEGF